MIVSLFCKECLCFPGRYADRSRRPSPDRPDTRGSRSAPRSGRPRSLPAIMSKIAMDSPRISEDVRQIFVRDFRWIITDIRMQ